MVPANDPGDNTCQFRAVVTPVHHQGKVMGLGWENEWFFEGDKVQDWIQLPEVTPADMLVREVAKRLNLHKSYQKVSIGLSDLKGSAYRPVLIGARYLSMSRRTNTGFLFDLPLGELGASLRKRSTGQVKDLFLGAPQKHFAEVRVKDCHLPHIDQMNVAHDTPWVNVEYEAIYDGADTVVSCGYLIREPFVPAHALTSETFSKLVECFENYIEAMSWVVPYESDARSRPNVVLTNSENGPAWMRDESCPTS